MQVWGEAEDEDVSRADEPSLPSFLHMLLG